MNIIKNKWNKTGLLKGLKTQEKVECANKLEDVANFLIKKYKKITPKSEMICGTLIPIVRRLYDKKLKSIPKASWLHNDYVKFINHGNNPLDNISMDETNEETECCRLYTENLCMRLNK